MCYDDGYDGGCDGGCDDGCDGGCDGGIIAAIVAGSLLLLFLLVGGIVALALIPVYLGGSNKNTITTGTLIGTRGAITASTLNGNIYAVGSSLGETVVYDLVNGGSRRFTTNGIVNGLQLVNNRLVSATSNGILTFWDVNSGKAARTLDLSANGGLTSLTLGPNNQIFAGTTNGQVNGQVLAFNSNGDAITQFSAGAPVESLATLSNGNIVVGTNSQIQIYNPNVNPITPILAQPIATPGTLDSMFVTAPTNGIGESIVYSSGNTLFVNDPLTGTNIRQIQTSSPVNAITQTSSGLVATAENTVIRFYNLANGNFIDSIVNSSSIINTLNVRNNDIIAGNSLGNINVFNKLIQNTGRINKAARARILKVITSIDSKLAVDV